MSVQKKLLVWPLMALLPALACGDVMAQMAQPQREVAAATSPRDAEEATTAGISIPSDAVWFATLDVKRFVENPIGQAALKILEQLIREEADVEGLPDEGLPDLKTAQAKIAKVIGFDPLEDIGSIDVYGCVSPFAGEVRSEEELVERMATTGVAVVTLSGGTGNLEGLALATPDYRSTEYGGATIHSGTLPDFPPRVCMAVLKREGTGKPNVVVFGLDENQVKQALDRVQGRPVSGQPGRPGLPGRGVPEMVRVPVAKGTFVAAGLKLDEATISALGIPQQQSAVFKMVTRVAFSLGAEDDLVIAQLTVDLVNQQRAEQVRQLVQGAVAFGELLLELPFEELNDRELVVLLELLKDVDVQVAREGVHVTCRATKPADTLLKDLMNEWTGQIEDARRDAAEEDARRDDAEEDARRADAEERAPDGKSRRP